MRKFNFILLLFLLLGSVAQAQWTTITNGGTYYDNNGNAVQAHGGNFLFYNGRWYMVGEDRTSQWQPDVNMYSSTDLKTWRFENKIIKNGVTHPDLGTNRFIERPKLLRCPSTGQFVVWCHWEQGNYGASEVAVFKSSTINGNYTFHWSGRPMGIASRDCNVFVDSDGTAYFISTTSENTDLGLFRLSTDYLSVVSHTVLFDNQYREAPAIVKIGSRYYMISSGLTGWDPNQAKLSTSTSLTSGWSALTNVGPSTAYDTQAATILTIQGTSGTVYLYVGDRWQDPGLPESKTIMFPVTFSGTSMDFTYRDKFDINFSTGQTRVPTGGGAFSNLLVQLKNRATGMVADGWGRTTAGEACAQQLGSSTHVNTRWRLVDAGSAYGSFYYIQNYGTGMRLDGYGRTSNGSDVAQQVGTSTAVNSQWIIEPYVYGYVRLRNRGTGLSLDGMGRTTAGSALGQYSSGGNNAQWTLPAAAASANATIGNDLSEEGNQGVIASEEVIPLTENEISIYPSLLSSGEELNVEGLEGTSTIIFMDVNGKVVKEQKVNETGNAKISISLSPGIYFVKIATSKNQKHATKKIIVNK
jgi:hypothetical protein